MDEVAQSHLGHSLQTSPPELTHLWKGNPAPSGDLSHQLKLEDIHVVREILDVFPDNLPGMPPETSIEFKIKLQTSITPIAKALYKMSPIELAKLKIQL
jgi:hypothetical protein